MFKSDELFLFCKSIFNDFLDVMQPLSNWRRLIQAETDIFWGDGELITPCFRQFCHCRIVSCTECVTLAGHFVTTFHATHAVNMSLFFRQAQLR